VDHRKLGCRRGRWLRRRCRGRFRVRARGCPAGERWLRAWFWV